LLTFSYRINIILLLYQSWLAIESARFRSHTA